MPSEIKAKFSTSADLTISLASLESSTAGVGRQSTIVDNTSDKWQKIHIYAKIRVGTSPTANRCVKFYLIKDDGDGGYRTDNAGASDAEHTVVNATFLASLVVTATTSNVDYYCDFIINNPGPKWGLSVNHDCVAALNSTGSNHVISWVGENPEGQ